MKKETIYKIGLTLVCASILAACGSSGNDNGSTIKPDPDIPDVPVDPDVPDTDGDTGEGEGSEYGEQDKVSDPAYIQGAQTYLKYNSNFEPGTPKTGVHRGLRQRMDLELHPSLDTIVLGWTKAKSADGARAIYLEDFDFTGSAGTVAAPDKGYEILSTIAGPGSQLTRIKLSNGHIGASSLDNEPLHIWQDRTYDNLSAARTPSDTKTGYHGKQEGIAVAYTHHQNNYTNTANYRPLSEGGIHQEDKTLTFDGAKVPNHDRQNTVAEVYGHRTFVIDGITGTSNQRPEYNEADARNLPLVNEQDERPSAPGLPHIYYDGEKLNHLQYGRVTSFLNKKKDGNALDTVGHEHETTGSFRVGKPLKNDTRIASWGKFGIDTLTVVGDEDTVQLTQGGTHQPRTKEDTYLYRGIGATTKAEVAKLAKQNVVAEYFGHAVTYGLNHTKHSTAGIPNAIGNTAHFVSGTHVYAKVDFADKKLTNGQLYNRWSGKDKNGDFTYPANDVLVKFEGKLNGNAVYGTATKNYGEKDAGKFVGTFYGESAQELGGNIYSEVTDKKAWGGVFGAITQEESSVGPGPNLD